MPVFYPILRGVSIGRKIIAGLWIKTKIISSFSGKMMYNTRTLSIARKLFPARMRHFIMRKEI
jgi:hypothetical protein